MKHSALTILSLAFVSLLTLSCSEGTNGRDGMTPGFLFLNFESLPKTAVYGQPMSDLILSLRDSTGKNYSLEEAKIQISFGSDPICGDALPAVVDVSYGNSIVIRNAQVDDINSLTYYVKAIVKLADGQILTSCSVQPVAMLPVPDLKPSVRLVIDENGLDGRLFVNDQYEGFYPNPGDRPDMTLPLTDQEWRDYVCPNFSLPGGWRCNVNPEILTIERLTIGKVSGDGSVYAGITPDGSKPMYVTPCDFETSSLGAKVDGVCPEGSVLSFDNGVTGQGDATGVTDANSGKSNTSTWAAFTSEESLSEPYLQAKACEDLVILGHSDWYLPSKNELLLLHNKAGSIGGFDLTNYSIYNSSTELSGVFVFAIRFTDGHQNNVGYKWEPHKFRCARHD